MNRWPTDGLIERVNLRIRDQIEKVEEMTGDMDPKTNFALILIQTELERWKYLVRGFLRARIAKVLFNQLQKFFAIYQMDTNTDVLLIRSTNTPSITSQTQSSALGCHQPKSHMQPGIKHSCINITYPPFCPPFLPRCKISTTQLGVSV